jgi:UDP-N-acetylglucosamine transferase subunit ALG13
MIFVTIGSHYKQFPRLLKKIDEIAPLIKEKIIIQRGYTKYIPKNCESFEFAPSLDPYYKKARLTLIHGASSVWEFRYKFKKPFIIVPRQFKFKEHINDHQVEFAEKMEKSLGAKVIYDMKDLKPQLLKNYNKVVNLDHKNLIRLQDYLKKLIEYQRKNIL